MVMVKGKANCFIIIEQAIQSYVRPGSGTPAGGTLRAEMP